MTAQPYAVSTPSSYRHTGLTAVTSGVIGVVAFSFLIAFLVKRLFLAGTEEGCIPLIRIHDAAVIVQSLLMIPLVLTLARIAGQRTPGASRTTVLLGVSALSLMVLFLLLIFIKAVPDDLYMIPLGLLALWLIFENRRLSGVLPRGLTRLGLVAGVGLLLVAIFPIGFTLFVDPSHLKGWTPFDYQPPPGTDAPNIITHILLLIGTFTGVATYPIWTLLVGRKLMKKGGNQAIKIGAAT